MEPSTYGPFPYSPIVDRPKLSWPGGARVAVWIGNNVEFFPLNIPLVGQQPPNVPAWSERDYGNRVGFFRLMEMLDRHDLRSTVCLNSDVCLHHPRLIEEGEKRGWEWMGHSTTNAVRLTSLSAQEQRERIATSLSIIADHTGRRPRGWLSPALMEDWSTLDHLAAEGVDWLGDWCNDDQPVAVELPGGKPFTLVQYSQEVNDFPALIHRMGTPDQFADMIRRTFDTLYREAEEQDTAKVMCIALHPFISGVPHRIDPIGRAIGYVAGHEKVWRTTGSEIVDAFRAQQPAAG